MKSKKTPLLTLLMAAGLALAGCAAGGSTETPPAPTPSATSQGGAAADGADTRDACEGVWAVVDFGELQADIEETCVDTAEPITASEAFESAGFELEGVQTSDQFFACRINGLPEDQLTFEGETYQPDCSGFGPAWAWWGLFIDAGNGWEFAMEGAELQEVAPGEAIAFAWQFGDTNETRLPA